jgi:hypothetical protein
MSFNALDHRNHSPLYRGLQSPMTNRQVNTFTAGLMVIALLSLIVLTLCSGCEVIKGPPNHKPAGFDHESLNLESAPPAMTVYPKSPPKPFPLAASIFAFSMTVYVGCIPVVCGVCHRDGEMAILSAIFWPIWVPMWAMERFIIRPLWSLGVKLDGWINTTANGIVLVLIAISFGGCSLWQGIDVKIRPGGHPDTKPPVVEPAPKPQPPPDDWAPPWFHRPKTDRNKRVGTNATP